MGLDFLLALHTCSDSPAGFLQFLWLPAGELLIYFIFFFCSFPRHIMTAYFGPLSGDASELISLDFLPPIINLLQY